MSRKKKHAEHVNHERWLVSYADFITLLFAFFTTLYAISTVDQSKAGKLVYSMRTAFHVDFFPSDRPAPANGPTMEFMASQPGGVGHQDGETGKKDLSQLADDLREMAADSGLSSQVEVRVDERGVVISLAEAAFFESAKAEVRTSALPALEAVADKLESQQLDILVEGHTDNVPVKGGRYRSNWELSTARATTVVSYFIQTHHFDPQRLTAAGYAEYKPVADNATAEGRARNRRVDIVVLPRRANRAAPTDSEATPVVPTAQP